MVPRKTQPEPNPEPQKSAEDARARQVLDALRGLRYGQVTVQVQDGVIVQIDRTERRRL